MAGYRHAAVDDLVNLFIGKIAAPARRDTGQIGGGQFEVFGHSAAAFTVGAVANGAVRQKEFITAGNGFFCGIAVGKGEDKYKQKSRPQG